MKALVLVLVAGLAACRSVPQIDDPSPGLVSGRIEGVQNIDPASRVQVYGVDGDGLVTREPFETVTPDRLGRFVTRVLSPGRYRFVYRNPDAPPSVTSVRIPIDTPVVLRPVVESGLTELRAASASAEARVCRLTAEKARDGIVEVREFRCSSQEPALLRGLRPGRWRLDLPEIGATTEIDLPFASAQREMVIDPPEVEAGATLSGEVRRIDGAGGAWLIVAVRPMDGLGETAGRWGRYAVTDLKGQYRVVGIAPGTALVRVECREVPVRILPVPHVLGIPPSGTLEMSFIVEP